MTKRRNKNESENHVYELYKHSIGHVRQLIDAPSLSCMEQLPMKVKLLTSLNVGLDAVQFSSVCTEVNLVPTRYGFGCYFTTPFARTEKRTRKMDYKIVS